MVSKTTFWQMLKQLHTKINKLESPDDRKVTERYQSACLACNGNNLRVTRTIKKSLRTIRTSICNECGTSNKQIINSISFKVHDKTFRLNDHTTVQSTMDHLAINIKDGVVTLIDPCLLNLNLTKDGCKNSVFHSAPKESRVEVQGFYQKFFDDGLFNEVLQSIEPVEIRIMKKLELSTLKRLAQDKSAAAALNALEIGEKPLLELGDERRLSLIKICQTYWSVEPSDGSDNLYFKLTKGVLHVN